MRISKRFLFYSLANSGSTCLVAIGVTMDNLPIPVWAITGVWFLLAGWTLSECKGDIRNFWFRLRGKKIKSGKADRILCYWDESENMIDDLKVSPFKRKFPKAVMTSKGKVKQISHPDRNHWSNKYS